MIIKKSHSSTKDIKGAVLFKLISICLLALLGYHFYYVYLHIFASGQQCDNALGYSWGGTNIVDFYTKMYIQILQFFNLPSDKVVIMHWIELAQLTYWISFFIRLCFYSLSFILICVFLKSKQNIFYLLSLCCFVLSLYTYIYPFETRIENVVEQHNAELGYQDYAVWTSSGFDIQGLEEQDKFTTATNIEVIEFDDIVVDK